LLEVSAATGVRWAQAWRSVGAIEPGKVGGHRRYLLENEREWLVARIEQEKDLTLHELLADLRDERGVVVCCDTLWRFLRRHDKTYKKRQSLRKNKTALTLSAAATAGTGSSAG
jgi:putative transposase